MTSEAPVFALDVGTRKVGLAQSLPLGIGARPLGVYTHELIWSVLGNALGPNPRAGTIVVGWPLNADGSRSSLCDLVEAVEQKVRNTWPHVDVVRVDERCSSAEARDRLQQRAGTKKRDTARLDDEAACILLEDYLRGDTGET